jgi:anti-sigma regulatory factor (Ser/Thr protein kinase)
MLRQVSQRRNVPVRDLAAWLVAGTVRDSRPQPDQDPHTRRAAQASKAPLRAVKEDAATGKAGMRTGAARGHVGHFHEAGFYSTDAEFAALIVPVVEEGLAAGEPVIIGYDERKCSLLRSWLTDPSAVEFIGDKSLYATPARAIAAYRQLFEYHLAMGAGQIRIAGDVPHPGNGGRFDGWDRYEWAVNTVWQDFPVWGRCLYDATTAPPQVLDVVERAHPRLIFPSGEHQASDRYQHTPVFDPLPPAPEPLEASQPRAELTNPAAAEVRQAVARIGRGRVPEAALADLIIGASEAVSNARRHGQPPATVRIWATLDRIVVTVHDTGPGPADPLAGLAPAAQGISTLGMGLWVVHQLDIDAALMRTGDGFTVRLRAGAMPD